MTQKEGDKLALNHTQRKFALAGQRTPHTYRENGSVEFGDHIMLKSC